MHSYYALTYVCVGSCMCRAQARVQATVGVGTVLIWDFGVAYTRGGGSGSRAAPPPAELPIPPNPHPPANPHPPPQLRPPPPPPRKFWQIAGGGGCRIRTGCGRPPGPSMGPEIQNHGGPLGCSLFVVLGPYCTKHSRFWFTV